MQKKYFKAQVTEFVNIDGGKQAIICSVSGQAFLVVNGANGYAALSPNGVNPDGGITFGGFAAIEIEKSGTGYALKHISDAQLSG